MGQLRQEHPQAAGDPERAAQILVQIAGRTDIPEHLPLGAYAAEASIAVDRKLLADDLVWRPVSRSADFGEPYPVPLPPDSAVAPAQQFNATAASAV